MTKAKKETRNFLTDEHVMFRDSVRKFIEKEIEPNYEQWEKDRIIPRELWTQLGEQGFLCPSIDEKYGGMEVLKGLPTQKYKQYIHNCFALCPRQVLHAKTLGFKHPRTGEMMHFDSEWAEDMLNLINKWRNYEYNSNLMGR